MSPNCFSSTDLSQGFALPRWGHFRLPDLLGCSPLNENFWRRRSLEHTQDTYTETDRQTDRRDRTHYHAAFADGNDTVAYDSLKT